MALPSVDGCLITLPGPTDRTLRAEAHPAQEPPNVDGAKARASEFDDQRAYPWKGPQIRRIPLPLGSGQQASPELFQQGFVDRALATETAYRSELLFRRLRPAAHRLSADIEPPGHLGLRYPVIQKLAGGQPAFPQFLRIDLLSNWHSHITNVPEEMQTVTSLSKPQ